MVEEGLSYKLANVIYGQILSDSPIMTGQTTDEEKCALRRQLGDIVARKVGSPVKEDNPMDSEFRQGILGASIDMSFYGLPLPSSMSDSKGGINARFGVDFPVEYEDKPNEFTAIFGNFDYKGEIPVGKAKDYFGPFLGNAKRFVDGICEDYCSARGCDIIMPFYFKTIGLDVPKETDIELLFVGKCDNIKERFEKALGSDPDLKAVVKDFMDVQGMPFRRKDSFRDAYEIGNEEKKEGSEKQKGITNRLMISGRGYNCRYAEGIAMSENRPFLDTTNILNCINYPLTPEDKEIIYKLIIYSPVDRLISSKIFGPKQFDLKGLSKRLPFAVAV